MTPRQPAYVAAVNAYRVALDRTEELRAAMVTALQAERSKGTRVTEIADALEVSRGRVYQLLNGKGE